jgi:hypothetical protein
MSDFLANEIKSLLSDRQKGLLEQIIRAIAALPSTMTPEGKVKRLRFDFDNVDRGRKKGWATDNYRDVMPIVTILTLIPDVGEIVLTDDFIAFNYYGLLDKFQNKLGETKDA